MSFLGFVKGSSDPNHFIFEINVGKSLIRYRTTLKLNDEFLDCFKIDRNGAIRIPSRSISNPSVSDIDFKNKINLVRTLLNRRTWIVKKRKGRKSIEEDCRNVEIEMVDLRIPMTMSKMVLLEKIIFLFKKLRF